MEDAKLMIKVAVTCTHLIRDIEGYRSRFADAGLDLFLPDIPGQELAGDALVQAMDGIIGVIAGDDQFTDCLLYTSPSPRDQRGSRMPSSA